jgi:hypothetical protein
VNQHIAEAQPAPMPASMAQSAMRTVLVDLPRHAALPAALAAVTVYLAFLALTYAGLGGDRTIYRDRIADAFASGALTTAEPNSLTVGNECLTLSSLISAQANRWREILSPKVLWDHCPSLYASVTGDGARAQEPIYYEHYIHGARPVWLHLLKYASVAEAFKIVFWAGYGMLALALGFAVSKIWSARRTPAAYERHLALKEGAGFAAIIVVFALFYGWTLYGPTITHGLWGLVIFALVLAAASVDLTQWPLKYLAFVAGVYGAALAHFDLLYGAAPLGLAVLIGVLALQGLRIDSPAVFWQRIAAGAGAMTLAFIFSFLIKFAITMIVLGPASIPEIFGQVLYRIGGSYQEKIDVTKALEFGFDARSAGTYSLTTLLFLVGKLAYSSAGIAFGDRTLGIAVLGLATLVLLIGSIVQVLTQADPRQRRVFWSLLASIAVIPLWYLIFLNHSVIHTRFMVRILVWVIAGGALVGAFAVMDWAQRRTPRDS